MTDEEAFQKAQKEVENALDDLQQFQRESAQGKQTVPEAPFCSFCGKGHNEVRKMMAGKKVFICNECVDLAKEIFDEEING